MILSSYPSIDLHGFDREYALFKVKEFINDCYKLKYEYLVIVHGIGSGILKNAVLSYLKTNKRVAEYKLDFMNPGCTIVRLKFDK
ncbi:MAG TPA: Smr/MutS family protein [Candidatus Onthousia faecavium]|nr:Smr/MutS family protein [Candidatus Onthousia faecavium]